MCRTPTFLIPGQRVRIIAPYSEVCCYMRIAGRPVEVELIETPFEDRVYHSAQLYKDGKPFSAPVTPGEGGLYSRGDRYYTYEDTGEGDADPDAVQARYTALILAAFTPNPSVTTPEAS